MGSSEVLSEGQWSDNRDTFNQNYSLGRLGSKEYWPMYFKNSELTAFKESAYKSPGGYSIRTNPWTGYKELFIAGTRGGKDWLQNVAEGSAIVVANVYSDVSDSFTQIYVEQLEQVIKDNDIEVVYGHSRGAAIMSKLQSPNLIKVGLDAATIIGDSDDYLNISQTVSPSGLFDNLIGMGHTNTIRLSGRGFHDVTRPSKQTGETKKKRKSVFTQGGRTKITKKGVKKEAAGVASKRLPKPFKAVMGQAVTAANKAKKLKMMSSGKRKREFEGPVNLKKQVKLTKALRKRKFTGEDPRPGKKTKKSSRRSRR